MEDIEVVVYDLDYIPDYKEAEEERQANEAVRVSNEAGRVEAEGLRVTAEQGRVDAEALRVTAEGNRVIAENGRVGAEADRVLAEQGRVSAEEGRVAAEEAREAVIDSLATVATSGSYTDLTDTPTKVSDFTNDLGFIDKDVNNLTNYTTTSSLNFMLAGKQNTLSWDMTPTSGSYNAISSGAVYTALGTKQDVISGANKVDADLVDDSTSTNKFLSAAQKTIIDSVQTDYAHTLTLSQNTTTGDLTVGINNYSGTSLDSETIEGIATRTYVDNVVGDISSAIDLINGEVI